jgi:PIN domain nuclease of toxin-antitoxin system
MRLLLDTYVVVWWFLDLTDRIGPRGVRAIEDADEVLVSVASVWEMEIKRAIGKLDVPEDVMGALRGSGFSPLRIELEHAVNAGRLPMHHRDPFDCMLVAQANLERVPLVTADAKLLEYDVEAFFVGQVP